MDSMKGEIQEKIVKLRDMSEYTAKVMSDSEAELLLILNKKNFDMTRFYKELILWTISINNDYLAISWMKMKI